MDRGRDRESTIPSSIPSSFVQFVLLLLQTKILLALAPGFQHALLLVLGHTARILELLGARQRCRASLLSCMLTAFRSSSLLFFLNLAP